MFKRLLFGNEAKLHFKTSPSDGIARLYSEANIPLTDVQYWRSYLRLFDSANDVFTLLSVADVRRALVRHPENVETLVNILTVHLESLQHDPDFSPVPQHHPVKPSSPTNSISRMGGQASTSALSLVDAGARGAAALGSLLGGAGGSGSGSVTSDAPGSARRERMKEALNCCRVLTRLLPIIMEGDHDANCNIQADGGIDQSAALESDSFEQRLLWSSSTNFTDDERKDILAEGPSSHMHAEQNMATEAAQSQEQQFVIEESDEEEAGETSNVDPLGANGTGHTASGRAEDGEEDHAERPERISLGERLTKTAVDMLFYSGFTIPWTEEQLQMPATTPVATSRIHYTIWEKGIGSSVDLEGRSKAHELHRLEVLRLLLVLLSKTMYVLPNMQRTTENHPLCILTTSMDRAVVLPLLCSLINVSVVWIKSANRLGGLASLPAGLVKERLGNAGSEDTRQATVSISLQLLNVLLGYEASTSKEEPIASASSGTMTPSMSESSAPGTPRPPLATALSTVSVSSVRSSNKLGQQNLFRLYLSKLHRQSDFQVLADGIFAVLAQRPSAAAILNPSPALQMTDTSAAGPHIPETILLLWRLLWQNSKFRTFLLDDRSPQLLGHLSFHALNNKDSAARQGLVRLIVFILHDISCDRAFAVNICKAGSGSKARITGSQRWGIAVGGGSSVAAGGVMSGQASQASMGADIAIQAMYALIATTKSTLSALYPPMVITLTNISPYFKNLSILSANRLMALFTSFSNPAFLLADEGNPRVLFYLIELLNNIVQHGFQRNPNVAYAIVRNHQAIERLANFTLRRGIAEIRRSRRRVGLMGSIVSSPRNEEPLGFSLSSSGGEQASDDGQAATVDQETELREKMAEETQPTEVPESALGTGVPASEKARGKMRRSSTSSDLHARLRANTQSDAAKDEEDTLVDGFNEEELYLAASMVGRNGFVPTQSWVTSWHKGLPLDVLQVTVVELVPKVQELCSRIGNKSDADERVLALLREQSLDDVLPTPATGATGHGAVRPQPRAFRWTPQVSIWLLSYLWGLIYVTSSLPYGLFNGSCARLFQLRTHDKAAAARTNGAAGPTTSPAGGESGGPIRRSTSNDVPSPAGSGDMTGMAGVSSMVFGSISSVLGLGAGQSSKANTTNAEQNERDGTV